MDQISIYLPGILLAYATFFIGIASPGPNVLAIIGTSMSVGRRSGIALALGVAAGSFCWAMLASYAAAPTVLKIAGGLYLPPRPRPSKPGRFPDRPARPPPTR